MTNSTKSSLSKNVLQMKFMKRSALQIEKEKSEEEKQRVIDDEHWVLDLPDTKQKESRYVFEPSYVRIENLRFGRFSSNGYNPEVEKLMRLHNTERDVEESERKEDETSVNDQDMAQRFKSLSGTIAKKFSKKRNRSEMEDSFETSGIQIDEKMPHKLRKKNKKFMKPKDD